MSHPRRNCPSHLRALFALMFTFAGLALAPCCNAGSDDAFYHQLLKTQAPNGYQPTRTFTIVTDTEHGNQLVAEDDPDLQFNQLWLQQYKTGYRARQGGAAIGELFRSYVKTAYKSFRDRHAQSLSALPDENGSVKVRSFSDAVDYRLNFNGGDVKVGVQYSF